MPQNDFETLTSLMASSLPESSKPHLRNPYDALALLSHACMLSSGFRLVGLGEDHTIKAPSTANNTSRLPSEWNHTSTSNYAFRYTHQQSSLNYLIKISRLSAKGVINGLGIGDDRVYTFSVQMTDYFSASSFPYTYPDPNIDTVAPELQNLFIFPARLSDLANQISAQIIQKLAPGIGKEGYEASSSFTEANTTAQADRYPNPRRERDEPQPHDLFRDPDRAQPHPFADPIADGPRRSYPAGDFAPPDFEDEYEMNWPGARGGVGGARRPLNIGERDLYPPGLGPNDPLRGGLGGIGGLGGGMAGGMYPTFDDPLFRGGEQGGGYNTRVPPGARYDPVGPGEGPPNLQRGPRFPGGDIGMGRPGNPFGGFGGNDFI